MLISGKLPFVSTVFVLSEAFCILLIVALACEMILYCCMEKLNHSDTYAIWCHVYSILKYIMLVGGVLIFCTQQAMISIIMQFGCIFLWSTWLQLLIKDYEPKRFKAQIDGQQDTSIMNDHVNKELYPSRKRALQRFQDILKEQKNNPYAIMIAAPWGSGKTSFVYLRCLKSLLRIIQC